MCTFRRQAKQIPFSMMTVSLVCDDCWDYSKKIAIAFRAKAMVQLAQIADGRAQEYKERHATGELRHPLLASLRVCVMKSVETPSTQMTDATEHSQSGTGNAVSVLVVEAEPLQAESLHEIPNDAVDTIHGLLAARPALTGERLVAAPLQTLHPSPFSNIAIDGEPCDKVLALLKFTQRSVGKQISNGFRHVTDNVEDACSRSDD